jgi:hypothetical protein
MKENKIRSITSPFGGNTHAGREAMKQAITGADSYFLEA